MVQRKHLYTIIAILAIALITSCHNYYKATSTSTSKLDSLHLLPRHFILRTGSNAFYMNNLRLSEDKKSLRVWLDTLPPQHRLHLNKGYKGQMRYRLDKPEDLNVLNEVHLYIPRDSNATAGSHYTMHLDSVQKIEVLEKDKARTTESYVLGAIGYTLGALTVAGIIIVATKSSCPFVSGYTDSNFVLQGEIYGGAIYPQLVRHDYLPLCLDEDPTGRLQVKISNELKEKQFTDLAELWVIHHRKGTTILADESGTLSSIHPDELQAPFLVDFAGRANAIEAVTKANDFRILAFDDSTTANGLNEAVMHFRVPKGKRQAKLVLNLKNSYWLDYLYGDMIQAFGSSYAAYMKQQESKSKEELLRWMYEQNLPLTIEQQTAQGWKLVTRLTTVGPLARRNMIVPVTLDEPSETCVIRLRTGFMFWEIDAAGMDFSPNDDFIVERLAPLAAVDEKGRDVMESLNREDGIYLEQPEIGNVATITYKRQQQPAGLPVRSYILHAKGYYQHIRSFDGAPNLRFLRRFLQPNALPLYGQERFQSISQKEMSYFSKN